jgi:hypothetical protein
MAHTTRAPRSLMSPVGDTPAAGVLFQDRAPSMTRNRGRIVPSELIDRSGK